MCPSHDCGSVRVLRLDGAGRVLLVRLADQVDSRSLWIAPGGGVEAGESTGVAACRELAEELGATVAKRQLEGPVWRQRIVLDGYVPGWDGVDAEYFATRVEGLVVDRSTVAAEWAVEGIADAAWWSTARMREQAGSALFSPRALPDLVDALAADGPGSVPRPLGL